LEISVLYDTLSAYGHKSSYTKSQTRDAEGQASYASIARQPRASHGCDPYALNYGQF